ncbi:MAG: phosphatidylglycerol lysyltransferase domain-containing protein [Synergistaceae bacterium]|nr:phosphatidylglycerol lysyltransferase domain-containing protein [Synergistaceae bacterium]
MEVADRLAVDQTEGRFKPFEPLTLETKALYDDYIQLLPGVLTSPCYFQSLYSWNFASLNRYKIFDGHLCLVTEDLMARETFALPPLGILGDGSFAAAVDEIFSEFEREGLICSFHETPGFMLPHFVSLENYEIDVSYDTDWSDYVFTRNDFIAATEKKSAREAMRRFIRDFRPDVREISASDKDVVCSVTERTYCAGRECSSCFCGCELEVVSRMVDGWDALDMDGLLIESGGEVLAFGTVCRQKDTLLFLSKKVRRGTRGLNEYLNAALMERFGGNCCYVNYSEDMGSEGLRSYKSRLGRHVLMHRYVVRLSN